MMLLFKNIFNSQIILIFHNLKRQTQFILFNFAAIYLFYAPQANYNQNVNVPWFLFSSLLFPWRESWITPESICPILWRVRNDWKISCRESFCDALKRSHFAYYCVCDTCDNWWLDIGSLCYHICGNESHFLFWFPFKIHIELSFMVLFVKYLNNNKRKLYAFKFQIMFKIFWQKNASLNKLLLKSWRTDKPVNITIYRNLFHRDKIIFKISMQRKF